MDERCPLMRPKRQPHLNEQGKHDAQKEGSMDRKQFLKTGLVAAFATAAMAGPGRAFADSAHNDDPGEEGFDETFDVIVVGSGLAATVAAVTAAEAGAQTLVLEKMGQFGGTSRVSGLNCAIAGSDEQGAEGIEDDPEWMYEDMRKVAEDYGDPDLARVVAEGSQSLYRFLTERGATFKQLKNGGGHSAKRLLWALSARRARLACAKLSCRHAGDARTLQGGRSRPARRPGRWRRRAGELRLRLQRARNRRP